MLVKKGHPTAPASSWRGRHGFQRDHVAGGGWLPVSRQPAQPGDDTDQAEQCEDEESGERGAAAEGREQISQQEVWSLCGIFWMTLYAGAVWG